MAVAQSITAEERGVAVCTGPDGGWSRARSHLTPTEEAVAITRKYAATTPILPALHGAVEVLEGDDK